MDLTLARCPQRFLTQGNGCPVRYGPLQLSDVDILDCAFDPLGRGCSDGLYHQGLAVAWLPGCDSLPYHRCLDLLQGPPGRERFRRLAADE